jgi:hypothetical protein
METAIQPLPEVSIDEIQREWETSPDFAWALRYLRTMEKLGGQGASMKERHPAKLMEAVAKELNITVGTLSVYRSKWRKSGVLKDARDYYLAVLSEAVERAEDRVFHFWPLVIDRQLDIAINGAEKYATGAAEWLRLNVIEPNKAGLKGGDAGASSFLERLQQGGVKVTRKITLEETETTP